MTCSARTHFLFKCYEVIKHETAAKFPLFFPPVSHFDTIFLQPNCHNFFKTLHMLSIYSSAFLAEYPFIVKPALQRELDSFVTEKRC